MTTIERKEAIKDFCRFIDNQKQELVIKGKCIYDKNNNLLYTLRV